MNKKHSMLMLFFVYTVACVVTVAPLIYLADWLYATGYTWLSVILYTLGAWLYISIAIHGDGEHRADTIVE